MLELMVRPDLEARLDAETWAQRLALLRDDHKHGVRAFFEKRIPQLRGT